MIKPLKGWRKLTDETANNGGTRERRYSTHKDSWDGVMIDIRESYYSKQDPSFEDTFYVGTSGIIIGNSNRDFTDLKSAEKYVTNIMKYVNYGRELGVLEF